MTIRRITGWAAGAVLLLLADMGLARPALADDAVTVTLSRIAGTVESLNTDQTGGEWLEAYPGDTLGTGWSLRTGPSSKALLVFPLGNTVVLKENSYLTINAVDASGGAQLQSNDGGVLVNIKNHLSGGAEFQVDAGAALAVVRGTKFGAFYRQGGLLGQAQGRRKLKRRIRFYGFDGTVTLRNKFGEQKLEKGYDVDADEGLKLHQARQSSDEAKQFLTRLERSDEFDQFEKEHPIRAEMRAAREAKRKQFIENAKQRRLKGQGGNNSGTGANQGNGGNGNGGNDQTDNSGGGRHRRGRNGNGGNGRGRRGQRGTSGAGQGRGKGHGKHGGGEHGGGGKGKHKRK